MTTLARRRLFSVLLAIGAMALVVGVLVGFWLWRDGRFLTGTPGRVAAIMREVKRDEHLAGNSTIIDRVRYSLPSPLADLVNRLFPDNSRGESEFTWELAALGTNAIPPLLTTVEFEDSVAARRVAADALVRLHATQATPLFMKVLRTDADGAVCAAMASALHDMRDTNAIPALMEAMEENVDPSVRSICAGALGDMHVYAAGPMILAALEKEPDVAHKSIMVTALGELAHAPAVPTLIKMLSPPAPEPTNGNPVFRDNYSEHELRAGAAGALGAIGGEAVLEALVSQLPLEKQQSVGEAICKALAKLGGPKAVAALRGQLDTKSDFRAAAVTALGDLGDPASVNDLLALFEDRDDNVRAAAVTAIGVMGDSSSLESLRRFLPQEPMDRVRAAGCIALALMGEKSDQTLVTDTIRRMSEHDVDSIWAAVYLSDSNSLSLLTEVLMGSKDDNSRFAAAYGLALIGGADAKQVLRANLSDKNEYTGHGKACALLMLGDDAGLKTVRSSLQCNNGWQRFGAVLAVDRSGLKSAPGLLALVENDPEEGVRQFAVGAKAEKAPTALIELLKSGNDSFRHYAARALVFYHDTNAVPALQAACRDGDEEVRESARLTLRRIEREQSINSR